MWHLYQSGFAIKTARHLLVFDYWPGADVAEGGGGFRRGLVNPEEISEEDVVVFASHCHADHLYPGCLMWKEKVRKIRYVVSPEVSGSGEGLTSLGPNEAANVGGGVRKGAAFDRRGGGFCCEDRRTHDLPLGGQCLLELGQ